MQLMESDRKLALMKVLLYLVLILGIIGLFFVPAPSFGPPMPQTNQTTNITQESTYMQSPPLPKWFMALSDMLIVIGAAIFYLACCIQVAYARLGKYRESTREGENE